jgi:integrase
MPLDEARKAARIKLAAVDRGEDPAQTAADARAAWTVAEAAAAYIASAEFAKHGQRSQAEDAATLRLHLVHRLGREKLDAIDVPMVKRLIRAIEADTRHNRRRRKLGGTGAARRSVRVLSALLTWTVGEGQLTTNPIVGNLRMRGDGMRETVITTAEEYGRLFAAMAELVEAGKLRPAVQTFFILLAATGLRRGEALALRWADVNLADRRIILRSSKGARLSRTGGPKVESVSLPAIASAAIMAIRPKEIIADELVFMPERGARLAVNYDWRRICAAAGLPADLVIHSLRHSAATSAILGGLSTAEVSRFLRHRNNTITQRYLHLAETAQARLADRALGHVLPVPAEDAA